MKKLFHLGMIAGIFFSLSSCSKSAGDLVANEKSVKTGMDQITGKHLVTLNPRNLQTDPIFTSQLSKFYPFINQPYDLELGDNGATLNSGELAVFYVILSDLVMNETPVSATLSMIDDATGQTIETFNLISYRDVGTVDAIVPIGLETTPFMVALVNLGSQYIDKTVTLASDIQFANAYTPARLERAFTVIQ